MAGTALFLGAWGLSIGRPVLCSEFANVVQVSGAVMRKLLVQRASLEMLPLLLGVDRILRPPSPASASLPRRANRVGRVDFARCGRSCSSSRPCW